MATPLDKLAAVSPSVAEGFKTLRKGVFDGPLDEATVELIVVGSLAATGEHGALRVHVRRLLGMDVSMDAIRQAIVCSLAAASTLSATVDALDIAESLADGEEGA